MGGRAESGEEESAMGQANRWDTASMVAPRRAIPPRFLLAGAVALVAVCYLVSSGLSTATVYYVTVSELLAQGQSATEMVRVSGEVVPNTIVRDGSTVRFVIADAGGQLPVTYQGVVPDIFGDNIQVVVEGRREAGGSFQAATLLAKCPSKFEGEGGSGAAT
jgi:cytochrome c-type biogenesis protein CcmE